MKNYLFVFISIVVLGFTQCSESDEINPKNAIEVKDVKSPGNDIVVRKKPG